MTNKEKCEESTAVADAAPTRALTPEEVRERQALIADQRQPMFHCTKCGKFYRGGTAAHNENGCSYFAYEIPRGVEYDQLLDFAERAALQLAAAEPAKHEAGEAEATTQEPNMDRVNEIETRLAKIPPHFTTRGAVHGRGNRGREECYNTIMDHNGDVICDSANASYKIAQVEEYDPEDGRWQEVGTTAYFDVFANAPEDLRFLLSSLSAARAQLAEARRDERWIPTSERLPEPNCRVLVYSPTSPVLGDFAYWTGTGWDSANWHAEQPAESVTHWREVFPAPAPPPAPADATTEKGEQQRES